MTDHVLTALLERTADRVPDSDPPVAALLREGHRSIRRRRSVGVLASVAGLAVVGGLGVWSTGADRVGETGDGASFPPLAHTLPVPPAGMKWSGIGHHVVAVPRGWSMWPGLYCGSTDGHSHITIVEPGVTVGCMPIRPHVPPWTVVSLTEQKGGLEAALYAGAPMSAEMRQQSKELQQQITNSLTTLPPGWVAVPAAEPSHGVGTPSASDETRALKAAGFQVIESKVPSWGYAPRLRTEPEIGTPALVGSTITVYDQVSATASADLRGQLLWVGGPAGERPVPHAGTVHIIGNGLDEYLQAGHDGRFEFQGPAGTFTLTASSPGYLGRNGVPGSCRATQPVTLSWIKTTTANIYCQLG
jgi:hypothetical protein